MPDEMGDEWLSYRQIVFADSACIVWIAQHIHTLEDGRWPPPPPGHRVSDGPILPPEPKTKPKNKHYEPMRGREASFCRPEAIAAEFRRRFELVTGNRTAEHDRILFEEHFINDIDTWRLARIKGMPPWDVDRRINRVLKFLTGKGLHYIDGHVANYTEWMHKRAKEKHGRAISEDNA